MEASPQVGSLYQVKHRTNLTIKNHSKLSFVWLEAGEIFFVIELISHNNRLNWLKVLTSQGDIGIINMFDECGYLRSFFQLDRFSLEK